MVRKMLTNKNNPRLNFTGGTKQFPHHICFTVVFHEKFSLFSQRFSSFPNDFLSWHTSLMLKIIKKTSRIIFLIRLPIFLIWEYSVCLYLNNLLVGINIPDFFIVSIFILVQFFIILFAFFSLTFINCSFLVFFSFRIVKSKD